MAVLLIGCCGLHGSEISYPSDDDLRGSEEGDLWLFEIRGKNTKGGDPKIRDAWMPKSVADDIHKFSRVRELSLTDRRSMDQRRLSDGGSQKPLSALLTKGTPHAGARCRVTTSGAPGDKHLVERQVDVVNQAFYEAGLT